MKRVIAVSMAGLAWLTGCAVGPTQIPLSRAFHADEAQRLMQPGGNTVEGSALIRQQGGGVVTCAGLDVHLIPKTAYATERLETIWGNSVKGYAPVWGMQMTFTPDPYDYHRYAHHTTCDAQGRFAFNNVADGEFYLVTTITWIVAHQAQGGGLMQAINVKGGQSLNLVLSP